VSRDHGEYAPERVRVLTTARVDNGRRPGFAWMPVMVAAIVAGAVFAVGAPSPTTDGAPDRRVITGELDLTARDAAGSSEEWMAGRIGGNAMVLDAASIGGRIIAVGADGGRAAAWTTVYGDSWDPVQFLNPSGNERSVASHVVAWEGSTYVYGRFDSAPAIWRAASVDDWAYVGMIPAFDRAFLTDVVVGSESLLAVTARPDGALATFVSGDAVVWSEVEASGLEQAEQAQAFAAREGWFYAAGSDCSTGTCVPVVHRSTDGTVWGSVPLPDLGQGRLTDIAATRTGLVAVGAIDGEAGVTGLLLRSVDGFNWDAVGMGGSGFDIPVVSIELVSTAAASESATLLVDGGVYDLGVGATVRTDAATFTVATVGDDTVSLELPDGVEILQTGRRIVVAGGVALQRVSAQGDRVVVAGTYLTRGDYPLATVAGVWSSTDGGQRWDRSSSVDGAFATTVTPYTPSTRILLIHPARGETLTWMSEWATTAPSELEYASNRTARP